ncbi:MAG: hypothetical protein ACOYBE_05405 [Blautia sp.]|jgi:hypothetical protein
MYTIAICDADQAAADKLRMALHNVLDNLNMAHIVYYHKILALCISC